MGNDNLSNVASVYNIRHDLIVTVRIMASIMLLFSTNPYMGGGDSSVVRTPDS